FQRKEDMVITSVKDTGRGIDKNDLDTLFTKFGMIQGSYKTNKKASGTGLGLYISKSIIDIHQGKMDVFSEGLDQGSTFSFSLLKYSSENLKKLRATLKSKHSSIKEKIGIIHTAIQ
ncbi:hypothetical protein KC573_04365, partial [candidate division WWE3 bacterium]|nr:hypothetical protein [candidate division WWE3 bacterium]